MFVNNTKGSELGGRAVGIPGELRGFEYAHKRFGKVPWRKLFEPSIELARDGFAVSATMQDRIYYERDNILANSLFREMLTKNGELKKVGDIISRPLFADALKLIADNGANAFYEVIFC
jgi:gamma-glutamyltranspeptidase/glutathione hydrolase/leukotriene-C4 hydrolase